ncbi:amidase family protein [Nannocystis sp. SCPEA4]|uniref:amidase family protein n=1 Tax=Nannocystis sp. SCPEA4 TaxID=2996787 RepID=UPI00226E600C|nr:amidase family protein [Nannocystis sp. SCPEA4]MCY1056518.1 amidase family protein [Nannocystis sp. SCPEA4]
MANFDIDQATAGETARAVADGTISALDACEAAIARIEARDGSIHAVVVRDFARARAAARAFDAAGADRRRLPLAGVPMTVKESNDVAGLPTTWGFAEFEALPVVADALAVARLKAAGAIVLGKTNVPVGLGDWQSVNPVYGRTLHPYDPTRTPGGSSGGAAAALAAGMVPLELGSDIGGSIRVPAHLCGVFGHKPTYGIVPMTGHSFPGTSGAEPELAVVGPMARSAADLALALAVIAGPGDDSAYRLELPPPRHRVLSEHRVLVLDAHPNAATDAGVREPIAALAEGLARAGATVLRRHDALPDLAQAHADYREMLMPIMSRGTPNAAPVNAHVWMALKDAQARLVRQWRALFAEVDVVLTPPFGVTAFPHDDQPDWALRRLVIDGAETPFGVQLAWPGVATYPGLPATAVPLGLTREGLPTGVQVIGKPFADLTTIGFAGLLEQAGLAAAPRPPR